MEESALSPSYLDPIEEDFEDTEYFEDPKDSEDSEDSEAPEDPARKVRQQRRRAVLPNWVLEGSLHHAASSPEYFCCVCCRILFKEEAFKLQVHHTIDIDLETVPWPCLQYGQEPSRKNEELVACASHRIWKTSFTALINFTNQYWGNPLMHNNEQGHQVVEDDTPPPLQGLKWTDLPYICAIMSHSTIRQRTGTVLAFPHVDGKISMYTSNMFIRYEDGLHAMDPTIDTPDADRIIEARQWLAENNPLYRFGDQGPIPVPETGPQVADDYIEQLHVDVDNHSDELVTYSNPNLLALMFPDLFPYGVGGFSLWHHKTELRTDPAHQALPSKTIKDYAKYRLLHFDRRFSRNNRFICFIADWINKNAANGYRLRTNTTTRQGQMTTSADVLQGGRHNREGTMTLPQSIRTSVAYKVQLRHELEAMFRQFGTPEVFMTWSVNLSGPGFIGTLPTHHEAIKDVPKFCTTYNREWHRIWKFVRGPWAKKLLGGLRAYAWVTEYQDRGAPHVHFILWCHKSITELVEQTNSQEPGQVIVSCASNPDREDLRALVQRHQIHRHKHAYCCRKSRDGTNYCRFGFPQRLSETTWLDQDSGQVIYKRRPGDEYVNGYNPELLLYARSNIDIQLYTGQGVLDYLAKPSPMYEGSTTQPGQDPWAAIVPQVDNQLHGIVNIDENRSFWYHHVPLPELVMDVLSLNISRKSHKVQFISTQLPENRRHILKRAHILRAQGPDSTDIFAKGPWEKYLERPIGTLFDGMTYVGFYRRFQQVFGARSLKNVHQPPYNNALVDPSWIYIDNSELPRRYAGFHGGHECLNRHRSTPLASVDEACVHLLMLHWPTRTDCDRWLEETGHNTFFDLALQVLPRDILEAVQPFLIVGGGAAHGQQQQNEANDNTIAQLNEEQRSILTAITAHPQCYRVQGPAGTGKSVLLKALRRQLREQGVYEPIVLAPSGIAAARVGGQTIHNFFGAVVSKDPVSSQGMFLPNLFMLEWNIRCIMVQGRRPYFLIDDMSMISSSMCNGISDALKQLATGFQARLPFGGAPVVMFGDFGQLGPIVDTVGVDEHREWLWNSKDFDAFEEFELRTPCHHHPGDDLFLSVLSVIRQGPTTLEEYEFVQGVLKSREIEPNRSDAIILTSKKADAIQLNMTIMEALSTKANRCTFWALDGIPASAKSTSSCQYLERETGLLTELQLWQGAKVTVTSNINLQQGVINGTMGHVLGCDDQVIWIQLGDGRTVDISRDVRQAKGGMSRSQYPLQLAYALTIHRCQSLTLPSVWVNLEGLFGSGQAYVALSRVQTLNDLYVVNVPNDLTSLFPPEHVRAYFSG